jgi:hypothetical protein
MIVSPVEISICELPTTTQRDSDNRLVFTSNLAYLDRSFFALACHAKLQALTPLRMHTPGEAFKRV